MKLTKESVIIAVEKWLGELHFDYAKMHWRERQQEAKRLVEEWLEITSPKPTSHPSGQEDGSDG